MQPSPHRKTLELRRSAVHLRQHVERAQGYAPGVPGGLTVAQVNGRSQGVQSIRVTLLDLPKSVLQLYRPLADHLFEILAIIFQLPFQTLLLERTVLTH